MQPPYCVPVNFLLPPDLLLRLDQAAEAADRTRSAQLRQILRDALDAHAAALAEADRRFHAVYGDTRAPE